MNTLRNRVQLIGNLGGDTEVITFDSGKTKASFSIATKDVRKNEVKLPLKENLHRVLIKLKMEIKNTLLK